MMEREIQMMAAELSVGDKFLAEELRSEMTLAHLEYKEQGYDNETLRSIVKAKGQGYLAGRHMKSVRQKCITELGGDAFILKTELGLAEARIDFLMFQNDNLKDVIVVWHEAAEYWKNLVKGKE